MGKAVVSRCVRQIRPWFALVALACCGPDGRGELPIVELACRAVEQVGSRLLLHVTPVAWERGAAFVVAKRGGEPLGWFEPLEEEGQGALISGRPLHLAAGSNKPRIWMIGRDLIAAARARWPVEAELRARLDSVGLGDGRVWLDAGTNQGITVGQGWWQRINGQPAARYDVRFVGDDVCYCRVVSLVAGFRPARGDVVALWPGPGRQRTGRAFSAVSFVEHDGDGQLVWVAAPPPCAVPADARVECTRAGRYIGGGRVERCDPRFWYVRMLPGAGADRVRVSDDVVIRTAADIRAQRFSARIFEQTPRGYLIDAGEADGLARGDSGVVYRDNRRIGRVTLARVQRGYAVAQLAGDGQQLHPGHSGPEGAGTSGRAPAVLRPLDEVRFRPRRQPPAAIGSLDHVVDRTLFSAHVADGDAAPLRTPLAVRRAGRPIGVAILLNASDGRVLGFAIERSLVDAPVAGDELMLPAELGF